MPSQSGASSIPPFRYSARLAADIESRWQDAWDAQGTTRVLHRGAAWSAELAPGQSAAPGAHRIQAIAGNRLVLEKI